MRNESELADSMDLAGIGKVFILHDLYSISLKNKIKQQVKDKLMAFYADR